MMRLLDLQQGVSGDWEAKGYQLPKYDREVVKKKTKEKPLTNQGPNGQISLKTFRLSKEGVLLPSSISWMILTTVSL